MVTICGPSRFFDQAMTANLLLGREGWFTLFPTVFPKTYHYHDVDVEPTPREIAVHCQKILASDGIVIVEGDRYKGYGTIAQEDFAFEHNKFIAHFTQTGTEQGEFHLMWRKCGHLATPNILDFIASSQWQGVLLKYPHLKEVNR